MSAEMVTALTAIGVAGLSTAGSVWVGMAGRRTAKQQGRRDDFTTVTNRLDKEIERLEGRVTRQESRIVGQTAAINYLHGWVRDLMAFVRVNGHEPPPRRPVPEEAKLYLQHIDV